MAQAPRTRIPYASGRHFLDAELRCWRQHSGMSLAHVVRAVHPSPDSTAKIEKVDRKPSLDAIGRRDEASSTGGALARLRRFAAPHSATQQQPAPSPSTPSVVVRAVTKVIASGAFEHEAGTMRVPWVGPRLSALPGERGR